VNFNSSSCLVVYRFSSITHSSRGNLSMVIQLREFDPSVKQEGGSPMHVAALALALPYLLTMGVWLTSSVSSEVKLGSEQKPIVVVSGKTIGWVGIGVGIGFSALLLVAQEKRWDPIYQLWPAARFKRARTHYELGQQYLEAGQYQGAIREFQTALYLDPQDLQAHLSLGKVFLLSGNVTQGVSHLNQAKSMGISTEAWGETLSPDLLAYTWKLIQNNQLIQAEQNLLALDRLHHSWTYRAEIYYQLAQISMRQEHWNQALIHLQEALRLDPKLTKAYLTLGQVFMYRRNDNAAIDAFWEALNQDPQMAEAHHYMGKALFRQGRLQASLAAYRTALEMMSDRPLDLLFDLGMAYLQRGQTSFAKDLFVEAYRNFPEAAKTYYGIGQVQVAQGHFPIAIKSFEKALELDPEFVTASAAKGLCYLKQKHQEGAKKKFIYPHQLESATACFEEALKKNSRVVEAHFGLGEIFRLKGNYLLAMRSYKTTLGLNNSYGEAHYRLAQVGSQLGQVDTAIDALHTALELNPNFTAARLFLNRLLKQQAKELFADFDLPSSSTGVDSPKSTPETLGTETSTMIPAEGEEAPLVSRVTKTVLIPELPKSSLGTETSTMIPEGEEAPLVSRVTKTVLIPELPKSSLEIEVPEAELLSVDQITLPPGSS
jgi:tetratricopeptide (TPR) repeat protein